MANTTPDDSSEIGDEEFLFRLVHQDRYLFGTVQPCTADAFSPSPQDYDGISLTRERFTTLEKFVRHFTRTRRKPFLVVRLSAGGIREKGISIIPKPSKGGLRGHVLIPDVGKRESDANRFSAKEKALSLAMLASQPEALAYCHPDLVPNSGLPDGGPRR